jgi:PhnB protein
MTALNPYLNFKDTAREALEFYRAVFDGELALSTFDAFPDMGVPEAELGLIMHGQLTTAGGLTLMAADTPSHMEYAAPAGFAVSVSGDDEAELQGYWDGLIDGGTVVMPFDTPPWGGRFGMLKDRFGVDWMVALNASQD